MNLGNGYEVPVIQKNLGDSVPRAVVFVDASKQLTPAQAKRARFIFNLRDQYQKAKDSLAFIELFAASFGLSEERIETIKKINGDTLDELSRKFEDKLKAYDERISPAGQLPAGPLSREGSPHSSEGGRPAP